MSHILKIPIYSTVAKCVALRILKKGIYKYTHFYFLILHINRQTAGDLAKMVDVDYCGMLILQRYRQGGSESLPPSTDSYIMLDKFAPGGEFI